MTATVLYISMSLDGYIAGPKFARLYRSQKCGTWPRRSSPDERGPTNVDYHRSRRCPRPRHRTTTRRGPSGVNSLQPESKENSQWAKS
jgi:hypothetical protein